MDDPARGSPRLPRRAVLLAVPAVLVGHRIATRAQDQPATPAPAAPTASTPTTAAGSCPAAGPCPVGCWVVSDIGAFIESGLMDVTGVKRLAYVAAEGTLGFTFHPDGVIAIVADGYRVAVSAEIRFIGDVDTAVSFDGALAGRYTLAGEELTIADITRKDLIITAETPVGTVGIDNDDVFAGGASRLVCDPAGQTLRLYPDPENETAIILTKQVSRFA